jgi:hypothetical protein
MGQVRSATYLSHVSSELHTIRRKETAARTVAARSLCAND